MKGYQQYLRQGRGKRRKRGGVNAKRGQISGRVGIEHRPAIADAKLEIGHWESDTMIGKDHNPLPSFSERKNCIKALKSLYSRRIRGHASSQLSKAIRDTA